MLLFFFNLLFFLCFVGYSGETPTLTPLALALPLALAFALAVFSLALARFVIVLRIPLLGIYSHGSSAILWALQAFPLPAASFFGLFSANHNWQVNNFAASPNQAGPTPADSFTSLKVCSHQCALKYPNQVAHQQVRLSCLYAAKACRVQPTLTCDI